MSRPPSQPVRAMPAGRALEDLVLAALERALRHRPSSSAAPFWAIIEHLALGRRSGDARRVRAALGALGAAGMTERSRLHGVEAWELTAAGRRRLGRARRQGSIPPLPESPQHREWRRARTSAAQEIDRFARALREQLDEAELLLAAEPAARSDAWFELAELLRGSCRRLGSATYCLREWPEPREERADLDDRVDPGDQRLAPAERKTRRVRRAGRRNVTLWRADAERSSS